VRITQDNVDTVAPRLEQALQKAIEEIGLAEYRIDILKLTPKANFVHVPGTILHCTPVGPHGHVVCTLTAES